MKRPAETAGALGPNQEARHLDVQARRLTPTRAELEAMYPNCVGPVPVLRNEARPSPDQTAASFDAREATYARYGA